MKGSYGVFVAILILAAVGCRTSQPSIVIKEDPHRGFSKFIAGIEHFPYSMDKERQQSIMRNYPKLVPGLDEDDSRRLIGPPDCISREFDQKKQLVSIDWTYYFHRESPDLARRADEQLDVIFNPLRKIAWVVLQGKGKIDMRGHPLYGK